VSRPACPCSVFIVLLLVHAIAWTTGLTLAAASRRAKSAVQRFGG
jgi:hypothetical protein